MRVMERRSVLLPLTPVRLSLTEVRPLSRKGRFASKKTLFEYKPEAQAKETREIVVLLLR